MKRKIIIAPYEAHRILFSYYRKDDVFNDIKFITLEELVTGLTYSYSLDALKFVIKKFNLPLNSAISYLKVLSLLPEKIVAGYKELFLAKKELIDKKLFIKNVLFPYELSNAEIEVYYYSSKNPYLKKFLNGFDVKYHKDEPQNLQYKVFDSNDEQYIYVYNKIEQLLLNGVEAKKIFIYGLSDDDKAIIDRLNYNFGFNLNNAYKKHLLDLPFIKDLTSSFSGNLDETISLINKDDDNYEDLVSFFKDYYIEGISLPLQKEIYLEAANRIDYKTDYYKEAIKVISKPIVSDDEYLFIVNYAQGIIPVLEKDDDVIDDYDKEKLAIPTSGEINISTNEELSLYLSSKGHITLCYPKKNYSNKLMPSPLSIALKQTADFDTSLNNIYSFKEARLEYANLLDIKRKFIYEHPLLQSYSSKLMIPYQEYDSSFTGVNHFFALNTISLSYSSLSSYIHCGYKYYLDYVLHLDELESSFNMTFGSFSHDVLSRIDSKQEFEEIYEDCYKKYENQFTSRDKIFLRKLKDDLNKTFDFIKEYESHIENGKFLREEGFNVNVSDNIKLTGFIDKLIYSGPNNNYVSILDYKSGSETFNEDDVEFGLSLQLPIYSYIFNKHPKFKDNKLIAIFIEKILAEDANKFVSDDKYKVGLKIHGEYLRDNDALNSLDTSLDVNQSSNYFKFLVNADINNYPAKPSKHLHEQVFFDNLVDASEKYLLDVGYNVLENNFPINPKIYKGNNISCKYCSYRDICFRNNKQFVVLSSEEVDDDGD